MEKPILFADSMVRAILSGAKTMTRRVVKPQPFWHDLGTGMPVKGSVDGYLRECPYGAPGDRLYVRECWAPVRGMGMGDRVVYRADGRPVDRRHGTPLAVERWRPSIHMPRWASRLTLEVTAVRVERVQEISDADVAAEGVTAESVQAIVDGFPARDRLALAQAGFAVSGVGRVIGSARPIDLWALAWSAINGRDSWDANPWVWVVEFKRAEGP